MAIVGGSDGLAEALVRELSARGIQSARGLGDGHSAAILLHGAGPFADVAEAIDASRDAFDVARSLAPRMESAPGLLVTVQSTGGDFGLGGAPGDGAWSAGLAGLARTAALEWPLCSVRAIDVETVEEPEAFARTIADELFAGGPELEVGLGSRGRVTLTDVAIDTRPTAPRLTRDDVVVVTGGARGVTAACVLELAREIQPKIALLGRTALRPEPAELAGVEDETAIARTLMAAAGSGTALTPLELRARVQDILAQRDIRTFLEEVAATGARVSYHAVDVRDAEATASVFETIRDQFGPVTVLVHGAGVLADRRIADKTMEQFDRVFGTKVDGLRSLLDAAAPDPVRLLCVFGSVAGRFGNVGQADYAMANEAITAVAGQLRDRGCVVKAIGWGPWDGGMVTPGLRAAFAERGITLLAEDEGARRFVDEIQFGPAAEASVLIVGGDRAPGNIAGASLDRSWLLPVDLERYPFLDDHRVDDAPVLPAVLALEWFARVGSALLGPGAAIEDLRILKGVRLDGDPAADQLRLRAVDGEGGSIALRLESTDGTPRYAARAVPKPGPDPEPAPADFAEAWDLQPGVAYQGPLFHGPAFQVIRSLDRIDDSGCVATLGSPSEQAWPGGWTVQPALLDGGLQLLRLWAFRTLGRPTLPTSIGKWRQWASSDPARCVVRAVSRPHHVVASIQFVDQAGSVVAMLDEVAMHATLQAVPAPAGQRA